MTIYKHVFKQKTATKKHRLSRTLSVSAVVHLYSFSTKDQKTSEYDQEIPQSHTADQLQYILLKQRDQFHFERKL